jgi:hypothetical protein
VSADILKIEAEHCLAHIFQEFDQVAIKPYGFPLTDLATCRVFSAVVTETIAALRSSDSPLPPTALILAMIKLCHSMIDPPAEAFGRRTTSNCVPRAFAYELLDRLYAEVSPNFDFALDQVGRIVNEAGDLDNQHRVRRAFQSYRARQKGALLAQDLDTMVQMVWHKRYPHHATLLQETFLREAA